MVLELGKETNHALGDAQKAFIVQKVVQTLTNVRVAAQVIFVQRVAPSQSRCASGIFHMHPQQNI